MANIFRLSRLQMDNQQNLDPLTERNANKLFHLLYVPKTTNQTPIILNFMMEMIQHLPLTNPIHLALNKVL